MSDTDAAAHRVSNADALFAPAVARNRGAILGVLARVLPRRGLILEVASGSGEHIVHFAAALTGLAWQPSDPDETAQRSIVAHTRASGLTNIRPPLRLDAASLPWPIASADGIVVINMIHIAPWAATTGLMRGAGAVLPAGGLLYLYGPFREGGTHTAPSNAAFDADLRARNAAWGVRDVEAIVEAGQPCGLRLSERVAMPANNLSLVFHKHG